MTDNNTAAALAAFDAKHAAERAKLEKELAIGQRAPVAPHRAQLTSGGLPTWLHYKADTLLDALAIMAAAPIVPAYAYKGTFTRIQPEAMANDKSGEIVAGPFAASLKIDQGDGYGPGAELRFFVMAGDEVCAAHVHIEPQGRPSNHWQWGAQWRADPRGRKCRRGDTLDQRGDYFPNVTLAAMSDHRIGWGTGGEAAASYEYFWMADDVEGGSAHAAAQLATLAGERG